MIDTRERAYAQRLPESMHCLPRVLWRSSLSGKPISTTGLNDIDGAKT